MSASVVQLSSINTKPAKADCPVAYRSRDRQSHAHVGCSSGALARHGFVRWRVPIESQGACGEGVAAFRRHGVSLFGVLRAERRRA
jgi:hypothetical protein